MNRGFIHLDTLIVPQILRQYAKRQYAILITFVPIIGHDINEKSGSKYAAAIKL